MSQKKLKHFSEVEKQILLGLVQEKAAVLESKKSDGRTVELKKKAWEELTIIFNEQGEVSTRDGAQLKKFWENMKSRSKKDVADVAKHRISSYAQVEMYQLQNSEEF